MNIFQFLPIIQQELSRYFATSAQGAKADTALQPSSINNSVHPFTSGLNATVAGLTWESVSISYAGGWSAATINAASLALNVNPTLRIAYVTGNAKRSTAIDANGIGFVTIPEDYRPSEPSWQTAFLQTNDALGDPKDDTFALCIARQDGLIVVFPPKADGTVLNTANGVRQFGFNFLWRY